MPDATAEKPRGEHFKKVDQKLAQGAATNFLGILAKSLHPLFLVLATRLYGPAAVGVYVLAMTVFELTTGIVSAGWRDAVLLVGGRHAEREDPEHERALYDGLGQAVQAVLLGSFAMVALLLLGGVSMLRWFFPDTDLWPLFLWLLPAIPLLSLAELLIAATRAILVMRHDALVFGLLKPGAMVLTALLAFPFWPDAIGLCASFTLAHVFVLGASVLAFRQHFSLSRTLIAALKSRPSYALWSFAVPQSLNMTFTYFTVGIDVLLLGHFGIPAERIAFYATASRMIRTVRQVKLGFSTVFNPLIARFTADGQLDELRKQFATLTRWTVTIAYAVLILMLALRQELMGLFHESYTRDTEIIFLLAVSPLLSCTFGLAGNVVVMAGHSRWNLINSVVMVLVTFVSAWWLIPEAGIMGAALSSAVSALGFTVLQIVEMRRLVGVRFPVDGFAKPSIAALGATAVAFALSALLGGVLPALGIHIIAALGGFGAYVMGLRLLGLPAEDRYLLRPWAKKA